MLSGLDKTCGNGSPRKFAEADGIWRKLKFGQAALKSAILAKFATDNFGRRPPSAYRVVDIPKNGLKRKPTGDDGSWRQLKFG